MPAGGDSGRPGPPAGAPPRDRRHDEAADVQPQRRRVVRHLAITGNRVLEAAAPDWDTSADGSWRGALRAWALMWWCHWHRALAWVWGVAGRAGRACGRAPPLAGVNLSLVQSNPKFSSIVPGPWCSHRPSGWTEVATCSGAHSEPTGVTSLQVSGPSIHCGPITPGPGGG